MGALQDRREFLRRPAEISRGGELSSFSLPCGVPVSQPQNNFSSPFPQACFKALGRLPSSALALFPRLAFGSFILLFPAGASAYSTSSFLSQASLILQFYLSSELRESVNERDLLLCLRFWASSEGAVE